MKKKCTVNFLINDDETATKKFLTFPTSQKNDIYWEILQRRFVSTRKVYKIKKKKNQFLFKAFLFQAPAAQDKMDRI